MFARIRRRNMSRIKSNIYMRKVNWAFWSWSNFDDIETSTSFFGKWTEQRIKLKFQKTKQKCDKNQKIIELDSSLIRICELFSLYCFKVSLVQMKIEKFGVQKCWFHFRYFVVLFLLYLRWWYDFFSIASSLVINKSQNDSQLSHKVKSNSP